MIILMQISIICLLAFAGFTGIYFFYLMMTTRSPFGPWLLSGGFFFALAVAVLAGIMIWLVFVQYLRHGRRWSLFASGVISSALLLVVIPFAMEPLEFISFAWIIRTVAAIACVLLLSILYVISFHGNA